MCAPSAHPMEIGGRVVGYSEPPSEVVRAVLDAVDAVPPGHVTTYGRVAAEVRHATGRGSPREVGQVLARYGGATDWFRVVFSDGRLPPEGGVARAALEAEGVTVRDGRVQQLSIFLWTRGLLSGGQRSGCGTLGP